MATKLSDEQEKQRKADVNRIITTFHKDMTAEDQSTPLSHQFWNAGFEAGLAEGIRRGSA